MDTSIVRMKIRTWLEAEKYSSISLANIKCIKKNFNLKIFTINVKDYNFHTLLQAMFGYLIQTWKG